MDTQLNEIEKEFLDKNGYLVLENVLSVNQISKIKHRISEIQKEEGLRVGDIWSFTYRSSLHSKGTLWSKFKLKVNDLVFKSLRLTVSFLRNRSIAIQKILYMYSLAPENYIRPKLKFKSDLKQMLLNIIQQQEESVSRLCNLVNKGEEFDIFHTHQKVLNAVEHIVGNEFKLSSLNLRSPQKECWVQPLHVDWPWTVQPGSYYSSNTLWMLDDVTPENGPTRIIPGTHNRGKSPAEEMSDLQAPHPNEVLITAKAGSVLILNGHVWHGGTSNVSGKSRDIIQSYFVHRAHHPQQFQSYLLTKETKNRLNSESLKILDYPYQN